MTSYDRRGEGSPLVLVHGIGSRWQVFEPVIDALAEHHDVISVDLPGFGGTAVVPGVTPGPVGYAGWLAGFCESLGVERPHVVGNSMGGGIAIELGRMGLAGRVTAFSPIGFWGRPGRIWTQGLLTSMRLAGTHAAPVIDRLADYRYTRAAALAPFFGQPTKVSREDAKADITSLVSAQSFPEARDSFSSYTFEVDADLGKLREIPLTIAWGARDATLIHPTQSAKARKVMPFARHVDLPKCGHLPFNDDPALCARVILEEQP